MNFLSHYYLDSTHPSPYHKLGILLPDLISGFNQKMRKAVHIHQGSGITEHQQLFKGISKHYSVDKKFHNSPHFEEATHTIKEALLKAELPNLHYRTYFLAHVLYEMLLDRYLMTQHDGLLRQFYEELKQPNDELIRQYFVIIGKEQYVAEFFVIFDRFRSSEFLFYYLDNEKFAEALLRVYSRVYPVNVGGEEKNTLIYVTQAIEKTYSNAMQDVFDYMLND